MTLTPTGTGGASRDVAARQEPPPAPRGTGSAAVVNSTHVRLNWAVSEEEGDMRTCAPTHGQIATVAVETVSEAVKGGARLGALEAVRGAAKLDAKVCGIGSASVGGTTCTFAESVPRPGASGKAFVWRYRRKNIFGWSPWSEFLRVPAAEKAASITSAPARAPAPATAPPAPASTKAQGDCVDAAKLSGSYTCAQYAERKLCKMSFVAKNCRASCGLCGAVASPPSAPPKVNADKKKSKEGTPRTLPPKPPPAASPSRTVPPKRRVARPPPPPPPRPQVTSKSRPKPPSQKTPARNGVLLGDVVKESVTQAGKLRLLGGAEPMHRVCLGQQCGNHQPLIVLGSATLPKLTLLSGGDPE